MKIGSLVCSHCGHSQGIDPKYEGRQFACPQCGKSADVLAKEGQDEATGMAPASAPTPSSAPLAPGQGAVRAEAARAAAAQATWQCASSAKKAFGSLYSSGRDNPLFLVALIDAFLDTLRGWFKASSYDSLASFLSRVAQYAILVSAVLLIVQGVVLAVRLEKIILVLGGILAALLALFLQYVAVKYLEIIRTARGSSVLCFSSQAFFDVSAASVVIGIPLLIAFAVLGKCSWGGLFMPVSLMNSTEFWIGVATLVLLLFFGSYLFLNPEELLGVEINAKTTAGEMFLSFLALGIKVLLTMTPVLFGIGAITATLALVYYSGVAAFDSNPGTGAFGVMTSVSGFFSVLVFPVSVYFISILLYFFMDIALAVFRIARNTEK